MENLMMKWDASRIAENVQVLVDNGVAKEKIGYIISRAEDGFTVFINVVRGGYRVTITNDARGVDLSKYTDITPDMRTDEDPQPTVEVKYPKTLAETNKYWSELIDEDTELSRGLQHNADCADTLAQLIKARDVFRTIADDHPGDLPESAPFVNVMLEESEDGTEYDLILVEDIKDSLFSFSDYNSAEAFVELFEDDLYSVLISTGIDNI